jgi:hypothetical protein
MSILRKVSQLDADDILDLVGLHRKHSFGTYLLPLLGAGLFGVLVGVGIGLMAAPASGRTLRHDMSARMGRIRKRAQDVGEQVREGVQRAVNAAP